MKTSRGIVWGGLLVVFGLLWLLRNLDLVHIDWDHLLPYWPVLLIIAGLIVVFTARDRVGSGGAVGLLITLAVFGAIASKTDRAFDRHGDDWSWNWNDHDRDHDDNDDNQDEDDHDSDDNDQDEHDEDYNSDRDNEYDKKPVNGNYHYDMEPFIQKAKLNLEGGAGSFKLEGNTDKLFEANTHSNVVGFIANKTINKLENSATVSLKMEEGNVSIKNGKISNEASIHLNESPVWSVDLGIGAGKGDFNFSNYKVENLKVSTGVADLEITLGDKLPLTTVNMEAGVASITISIPKSVGCEVQLDGAMNVKSFEDIERVSGGLYRSPGYENATKKIKVNFEGGLSKVKIKRY